MHAAEGPLRVDRAVSSLPPLHHLTGRRRRPDGGDRSSYKRSLFSRIQDIVRCTTSLGLTETIVRQHPVTPPDMCGVEPLRDGQAHCCNVPLVNCQNFCCARGVSFNPPTQIRQNTSAHGAEPWSGHQIGPPAPNISLPAALSAIMLGAGGPKSRKTICVGGLKTACCAPSRHGTCV